MGLQGGVSTLTLMEEKFGKGETPNIFTEFLPNDLNGRRKKDRILNKNHQGMNETPRTF